MDLMVRSDVSTLPARHLLRRLGIQKRNRGTISVAGLQTAVHLCLLDAGVAAQIANLDEGDALHRKVAGECVPGGVHASTLNSGRAAQANKRRWLDRHRTNQ
jgi:hypothetical protein